MPITLPLHKMSKQEKLMALEAIWADLSQDTNFESPSWHPEALAETERQVAAGLATFSDWDEAKKRLSKAARLK